MNENNNLSKKDMIMVSLLESGCCTIEHIMNCFDFSYSYSRRLLNQNVKNNYLIVVDKPDIILGNAYFLTKKGKEHIENECLVNFYETTLTGELIEKYSNIIQSDRNKIKSELAHRVSVADFYYILLKQLGYKRFNWEIESELFDEMKVIGRTDATFSINNTFFDLEIDTGSVSRYKLINKFSNYAITNKDNLNFPCLLISTSFTYNLPRIIDINNKKYNTLIIEIEQLEKKKKQINRKRILIKKEKMDKPFQDNKYTKLSYEQLNKEHDKLLSFLETLKQYNSLLKESDLNYIANEITNDINLIQDLKLAHEIANTSDIDELNIKYNKITTIINEKKEEAGKIKGDFIKALVNNKFESRYNSIKSIVLKSKEFLPLLYRGLDMIVEPHEDMLEYINEQCDTKMLLKDYLSKLISEYIKYYNGTTVIIEKNKQAYHTKYPLHISKTITQNNTINPYMIGIEDIGNNNIGAIERVKELFFIMNKITSIKLFLIIICPSYKYFSDTFDWLDTRSYNNKLAFIYNENIRNSLLRNTIDEAVDIKDFNIDIDYVTDNGIVKRDLSFIKNLIERM